MEMTEKKRQEQESTENLIQRSLSPRPPSTSGMMAQSSSSVASNPMFPILAYCGSSILMTTTNKYVLSGTTWNLNFFLLFIQSLTCIIAIQGMKMAGIINFRDFKTDEAKKWFPITLLLIGMIFTGAKAIRYLSIPVYTIFKNLTIIIIAYGEVLWFGGSVTPMTLFSFGLMVFSSIVAAWADIQHALTGSSTSALSTDTADAISTLHAGYMWMLLNCFCSASYVLGMRKKIKTINFKDYDTMFYNNLLSIPVLAICTLFLEDWSSANVALNFPAETRTALIIGIFISGISTIFISYSSAWCVRTTSSTTYSMVGALNKLPIALSGLVFFNAPVTFGSVSAIGIGFISGLVYAYAKMKQSQKPKESILPTTASASSQSTRDSWKS